MDVISLPDPHDWWDILGVAPTEAIKNVSTSVNFSSNNRRKDVVSACKEDAAAEGTREADRMRARRNRWSEAHVMQQLAEALVPKPAEAKTLDRMSTLRLAVSQLKLRRALQALHVREVEGCSSDCNSDQEVALLEIAMGSGFVLVLSSDGQVLYVSESVRGSLGWSSLQVMTRSTVFDICHPDDHIAIKRFLHSEADTDVAKDFLWPCSALVRFKRCPRLHELAGARSGSSESCPYKILHLHGNFYPKGASGFFIGLADPIPHPTDNRFPMWWWVNQNVFTTVLTPDMKFVTADARFAKFLGWEPEDFLGRKAYEFMYPADAMAALHGRHCKRMEEQAKVQGGQVRLLAKGGGYAVVQAQKLILNSGGGDSGIAKGRIFILTRHWFIRMEHEGEIYSTLQRPKVKKIDAPPTHDFLTPPPSMDGSPEHSQSGSGPDFELIDTDFCQHEREGCERERELDEFLEETKQLLGPEAAEFAHQLSDADFAALLDTCLDQDPPMPMLEKRIIDNIPHFGPTLIRPTEECSTLVKLLQTPTEVTTKSKKSKSN